MAVPILEIVTENQVIMNKAIENKIKSLDSAIKMRNDTEYLAIYVSGERSGDSIITYSSTSDLSTLIAKAIYGNERLYEATLNAIEAVAVLKGEGLKI